MYLDRRTGAIRHHIFYEIEQYFQPGDVLVINKTRVIPARLLGVKKSGAEVEIFLLQQLNTKVWECLVRPGRKLRPGAEVRFSNGLEAVVISTPAPGLRQVEFNWQGDFWEILEKTGKMPLPPYIKRKAVEKDKITYQTIYAEEKGSVAAPTAGLHFTPELMQRIATLDVTILSVILHVGLGTFKPVQVERITDHIMHKEHCRIDEETAEQINFAKKEGRRIIAVGTTTTRTLESFAIHNRLEHGSHWTDLFLYPGKKFQIIDGLITNFHMPGSTLLMLVAAFGGYDRVMNAYRTAVTKKYRFFSYGDAMLIL